MYAEFFDLHTLPFENTPDPRFFFASEQHKEALAAIEYTIRMRKGFVLVTGDIGSGKTTVGWAMKQHCADSVTLVTISYGHDNRTGLLRQVLRGLGVRMGREDDHARLLERLQDDCLDRLQDGRPVVLFVDEAQTLSDDALEELRLLSNLDTATHKPIQVVLVGQPELRGRVQAPQHDALRQRIAMAKQLMPLNLIETRAYMHHRLKAASHNSDVLPATFEAEAIARIYAATRGVPRLINIACDNCMLLAFVRQTRVIKGEMVDRVVEDMVPRVADSLRHGSGVGDLRLAGSM